MHEASMAMAILRIVKEEAARCKETQISAVHLKVGVFAAVEPYALRAAFEVFAEGSVAEKAVLAVERVPAKAYCRECGRTFELTRAGMRCPSCSGLKLEVSGGRECLISGIEAVHKPDGREQQ